MAIPIGQEDVERVLRPWLGSLFLNAYPLAASLSAHMSAYAPYRQSLESLRDELEAMLLTQLNRFTNGSMTVICDNYHSRRLGMEQLSALTANFIKLNDYSLRVHSLNALRVLCQRYASFYTQEEFAFLKRMIRTIYPPQSYEAWLRD